MNKKGSLGPAPTLLDWIAWVLVVISAIIFLIIPSFSSEQIKNKINEHIVTQESKYLLLNVLRTPSTLDDIEMGTAQLIALWCGEPQKYDDSLKNSISKILNDFYGKEVSWELISDNCKSEKLGTASTKEKISAEIGAEVTKAEANIPLHYNPSNGLLANITLLIYGESIKEVIGKFVECIIDTPNICSIGSETGYKLIAVKESDDVTSGTVYLCKNDQIEEEWYARFGMRNKGLDTKNKWGPGLHETPVGEYKITERIDTVQSGQYEDFGPIFYRLNAEEVTSGLYGTDLNYDKTKDVKTSGIRAGIGIHGQGKTGDLSATLGCVRISNEDLKELDSTLKDYGNYEIPVYILGVYNTWSDSCLIENDCTGEKIYCYTGRDDLIAFNKDTGDITTMYG